MNHVPISIVVIPSVLKQNHYFHNLCAKSQESSTIRIANGSVMSHNRAMKGLSIEVGGA